MTKQECPAGYGFNYATQQCQPKDRTRRERRVEKRKQRQWKGSRKKYRSYRRNIKKLRQEHAEHKKSDECGDYNEGHYYWQRLGTD
jgi:hypothetical protein